MLNQLGSLSGCAGGRLVEMRADDLRFTAEESKRFLGPVMELPLDREQVLAVERKTEGWIAGLKMASLALRGAADIRSFLVGFTGSQRFILEDMSVEALDRQDEPLQRFLLRLGPGAALRAALRFRHGSADGRHMLETLQRRNLFLTPLDGAEQWYRYHPLFNGLLVRLQRLRPRLPPDLYRRAAVGG